jgi:hypothetical protein
VKEYMVLPYSNKLDTLNDAYEIFIEVINGQMVYFDRKLYSLGIVEFQLWW